MASTHITVQYAPLLPQQNITKPSLIIVLIPNHHFQRVIMRIIMILYLKSALSLTPHHPLRKICITDDANVWWNARIINGHQ